MPAAAVQTNAWVPTVLVLLDHRHLPPIIDIERCAGIVDAAR
jgi:hypothetical protein